MIVNTEITKDFKIHTGLIVPFYQIVELLIILCKFFTLLKPNYINCLYSTFNSDILREGA